MKSSLIALLVGLVVTACAKDEADPIGKAWIAFELTDYDRALSILTDAKNSNPNRSDIRTALGWTLIRLNDPESAALEFQEASELPSPTADCFAGWGFTLNALKQFESSNARISVALSMEPTWQFEHLTTLTFADLRVVKAENHFLTGEFASAYAEILELNPSFVADPLSATGRGLIAAEIERLKTFHTLN